MLSRRPRLIAAAALVLGILVGAGGGIFADQTYPDYVPVLAIGQPKGAIDQAAVNQALHVIEARYYSSHLDYRKLSGGTVRGMVQALGDPYSTYYDPQQFRSQQDNYAGRHTGVIGIYVSFQGDHPVISGLVPGSPAAASGLRTGDEILSIDGRDARGLSEQAASALIRGPIGTSVSMVVDRAGQSLTFNIQRANFSSPMVVSLLLGPVLYVRVYQFGDSTQSQFDAQLKANLGSASGVILDLRDNPGGYISAAAAMISRFVSSGEAFEVRDRGGHVERTYVSGDHPAGSIPLVVLVNGSTASSAEIVAGSLEAHHRAQLVGTKTFGKGSVQVDFPLEDGGDLHLTVQHWFLPDGRSIDKVGLQPEVPVDQPSGQPEFDPVQPSLGYAGDAPLNRALELLAPR
ncbi:MAG TPA: S41 family peptidase [Candidatus Dormibacteraeota bacterium]